MFFLAMAMDPDIGPDRYVYNTIAIASPVPYENDVIILNLYAMCVAVLIMRLCDII